MSSSLPFDSSPAFDSSSFSSARRRKSAFTFKHLHQLAACSTTTPLRVIAHVDLDAFYAQCELVRLGLSPSTPLAVQQWQGLIAINYPARAFGLSRHITPQEAQKLCPDIVMQHVATWKEGEDKWAYREDAARNIATQKVSLDPYRMQSRWILSVIKAALPQGSMQRVEKASIDEVFIDLSAHVHAVLLERFPEQLAVPPPYDDPTEKLPKPPTTALDWAADALIDIPDSESQSTPPEERDPDWDDFCMLIGSEIVRDVRRSVFEELHYTCSAGVSRNKMLAKLGSGHKKPNSQTVIRNRAVPHFLSGFKFTKIRNLGGKLGDEVVAAFRTDSVRDLLAVSLEDLQNAVGPDTGSWLYGVIRGEDNSEVSQRTAIKSMLSAKSFRPAINSFEQGTRWLRIFVGDIFSRCVEEGVLEHRRRPRTINLHHRQGGQTRSRQAPIPAGSPFDEGLLFDLAKNLLAQVVADGRAWPCANLSLSVGGFEDGVVGNKGIGGFLVRGEEAKAMLATGSAAGDASGDRHTYGGRPQKRRRVGDAGIERFFGSRNNSHGENESGSPAPRSEATAAPMTTRKQIDEDGDASREHDDEDANSIEDEMDQYFDSRAEELDDPDHSKTTPQEHDELYDCSRSPSRPPALPPESDDFPPPSAQPEPSVTSSTKEEAPGLHADTVCPRCNARLASSLDAAEHADWHFAKELEESLRNSDQQQQRVQQVQTQSQHPHRKPTPPGGGPRDPPRGRGRPRGRPPRGSAVAASSAASEREGGGQQMKIAFGRGGSR